VTILIGLMIATSAGMIWQSIGQIMSTQSLSQKGQEAKDRLRSQHDYQVNLKAELEIRHLHEKIDHLLSH